VEHLISESDTVLMVESHLCWDVSAITGARTVTAPFAFQNFSGSAARTADVAHFFDVYSEPEARLAILDQYHVTRVLLHGPSLHLEDVLNELLGAPEHRSSEAAVYFITPDRLRWAGQQLN